MAIFEEESFYKDLPNVWLDSIAFDMADESSPYIFQPTGQAKSNRYNMRNLSPVDYCNCALAEANIFEQAFWIGDVFVPEHYTQAVSCDESEKWGISAKLRSLSLPGDLLVVTTLSNACFGVRNSDQWFYIELMKVGLL